MRARFPLLACLLALTLLAAPASAQTEPAGSVVDVTAVRHPDTVLVERAFPVQVDLVNKGAEPRKVHLFGGAYASEDPPCANEHHRAFTHRVQAVVDLAPGEAATYPPDDGSTWWHVVDPEGAAGGGPARFCVFAAESESGPEARLTYFDAHASPLTVRTENALPVVDFSWAPETPRALEAVRFEATAEDADGDPLAFEWDFGHHTAAGRARAEGRNATHAFYPDGAFTVTLTVRDPWDAETVTRTLTVLPEADADAAGDDTGLKRWLPVPGPAVALVGLAAAGVALTRPRS